MHCLMLSGLLRLTTSLTLGGYHLHHVHKLVQHALPLTTHSSQAHHLSKCALQTPHRCIAQVSYHDGPPNEHLRCSMSEHACCAGDTGEVSNNGGIQALMGPEHVTLQKLQTQSNILTNGVSHIPKANSPSSNRQKQLLSNQ